MTGSTRTKWAYALVSAAVAGCAGPPMTQYAVIRGGELRRGVEPGAADRAPLAQPEGAKSVTVIRNVDRRAPPHAHSDVLEPPAAAVRTVEIFLLPDRPPNSEDL